MADIKSGLAEHISDTTPVERGYNARPRREALKRNCMRFWWLYTLIFLVAVVVIVITFIYGIYPRTSQTAVSDSTDTITSMALLNPTPDSFDFSMTSVLGSNSPFHPQLAPFDASVYLPGGTDPIMTLEIPGVHARNGAVTTITGQHITVTNEKGFTEYTTAVVKNKTVTFTLKGRTGLKLGTLPSTPVNYDTTITMAGMNSLSNTTIASFRLANPPEPDGTNLLANVSIPNPTVQTIELGTLYMSMYTRANDSVPLVALGNGTVANVTLRPGQNILPLRAINNLTVVLGVVGENPKFLTEGLPVVVKTDKNTVNGVEIPYLSQALQANVLTIPLNVSSAI